MTRKRVFSGIRPTGNLHLGNYLGAVRNWIGLQNEYDCIYSIVDYHAIASPFEPQQLSEHTINLVVDFLAAGVDPERSLLLVQSLMPEHTELAWILGAITPVAWLERVPTYKEKAAQQPDYLHLGLLAYPVLQAADIIMYKAEVVPVGEDQVPHVELTREIVRRFNHMFGNTFPEPEALVTEDTARVKSLTEPDKKMSKSLGPSSYIALADEPSVIQAKVMKAVTDTGPSGSGMSAGVANLFGLLAIFDAENYIRLTADYEQGSLRYKDLKETLAAATGDFFAPFRERRRELLARPDYVREVIVDGARRARATAAATMAEVKDRTGLQGPALRGLPPAGD